MIVWCLVRKRGFYTSDCSVIAGNKQLVHANRHYNYSPTPTGLVRRFPLDLPGLSRLLVSPLCDDVTPSVLPSKYGGGFVGSYGGA